MKSHDSSDLDGHLPASSPAPRPGRSIRADRSVKFSVSMPTDLVNFLDSRCVAFRTGRSEFLQLIVDAERDHPRREFTKRSRIA
jgi:hypothetical protein